MTSKPDSGSIRRIAQPSPKGPPPAPSQAPAVYGASDMDYADYLKVRQLLGLQVPLSKPVHHDEMLFIIIHQTYELWFKLIIHELETAIRCLHESQMNRARQSIVRDVQVMKLLVPQIHLLETMTPVEFLKFRDNLKPSSGFQSLQFREIEFLTGLKDEAYLEFFRNRPETVERLRRRLGEPDLRSAFYELLRRQGFPVPADASERERAGDAEALGATVKALRPIYESPEDHPELYAICEALVDLDEHFALWREHHWRVVERIIGFKRGTGGSSGVSYLRSTTNKKCFPALWDVRTQLGEPQ